MKCHSIIFLLTAAEVSSYKRIKGGIRYAQKSSSYSFSRGSLLGNGHERMRQFYNDIHRSK